MELRDAIELVYDDVSDAILRDPTYVDAIDVARTSRVYASLDDARDASDDALIVDDATTRDAYARVANATSDELDALASALATSDATYTRLRDNV